jgi:hypothetical protein
MTENVARAIRHARLRWIGAPLLLTGSSTLVLAVYRAFVGGSGWTVGLAAFGTGLALATFGANHDTAMAYGFAAREEALPRALKDEINEELERNRGGIVDTRPAPRIGHVIPVVAFTVQALAWVRLAGLHL